MVLALLVFEVVRNVSHYEGPSEFLTPDAHLMELLREHRTFWIKAIIAAGQQHRRIQRRATSSPDRIPREMAMWLAYQSASLLGLMAMQGLVHIDDWVLNCTFEHIAEQDADCLHWVHDESTHPLPLHRTFSSFVLAPKSLPTTRRTGSPAA